MKVPCALAPQSLALLAPTKRRCTGPYRKFRRGQAGRRGLESARDFRHGLLGCVETPHSGAVAHVLTELRLGQRAALLPRTAGHTGRARTRTCEGFSILRQYSALAQSAIRRRQSASEGESVQIDLRLSEGDVAASGQRPVESPVGSRAALSPQPPTRRPGRGTRARPPKWARCLLRRAPGPASTIRGCRDRRCRPRSPPP